MDKGLIHVYTGDGKGKTTAAIGLGIRALGNGYKVYMVQFLKSQDTSELKVIEKLEPGFKVFRFEKSGFIWTLMKSKLHSSKQKYRRHSVLLKRCLKEVNVMY